MAHAYLYGFGLGLGLISAIGAQNLHVLSHGLRRQACLLVVLLCILCDAVLMSLGVLGIGGTIFRSFFLRKALGTAGLLFVLACAARSFRSFISADHAPGQPASIPPGRIAWATLGVSLLNPHAYLDAVVLIGGASANLGQGARPRFLAGSLSASILWFSALGGTAYLLGPRLNRGFIWRYIDLAGGILMLLVAGWMVITLK